MERRGRKHTFRGRARKGRWESSGRAGGGWKQVAKEGMVRSINQYHWEAEEAGAVRRVGLSPGREW